MATFSHETQDWENEERREREKWGKRTFLRVFLFDDVFRGCCKDSEVKIVETHEPESKADTRSEGVIRERRRVPSKDTAGEDEDGTDGDFSPEFG